MKANSNHIANLFYREKMKRMAYEPHATVDDKKSTLPHRDDKTSSSSKFASLKKKPMSTSKTKFFEHSADAKDKTSRKHNSNTGSQKEGILLSMSKPKVGVAMPKLNINTDVKNVLYQSIKIDPNLLKSNYASRLHLSHTVRKENSQRSPTNNRTSREKSGKKGGAMYLTSMKKLTNAFDEYSCHPWSPAANDSRIKQASKLVSDRSKSKKKKKTIQKTSSSGSLRAGPLLVPAIFKDTAMVSSRTSKGSSLKPTYFKAASKK